MLLFNMLPHLRATCANKASGYTVAVSTVAPATSTAATAASAAATATCTAAEERVLPRNKLVYSTAIFVRGKQRSPFCCRHAVVLLKVLI